MLAISLCQVLALRTDQVMCIHLDRKNMLFLKISKRNCKLDNRYNNINNYSNDVLRNQTNNRNHYRTACNSRVS